MAARILQFITLAAYGETRARRRWHRWNAVTHGCATHGQGLVWMKEQEEEIRREEDYRKRVGTTACMGRVLRTDGSEVDVRPPRPKTQTPPTLAESARQAPVPPPSEPPAMSLEFPSGMHPDIGTMLPVTGSEQ
jgi:hypothetical protein